MPKPKKAGPNNIRARIDYLQRAAIYLQSSSTATPANNQQSAPQTDPLIVSTNPLSQIYISQMRGVSQKTQHRLPKELKRSFCKRCDTHLVPDVNCAQEMRNESRGGRKPWADVWVVRCGVCGTEKRFPQMAKRSKKLSVRKREAEAEKGTGMGLKGEESRSAGS